MSSCGRRKQREQHWALFPSNFGILVLVLPDMYVYARIHVYMYTRMHIRV